MNPGYVVPPSLIQSFGKGKGDLMFGGIAVSYAVACPLVAAVVKLGTANLFTMRETGACL
jgi:hypothetical protein